MKHPPDPDFEAALRASLEAHAGQAPPGDPLADQIIADAGSQRPVRFAQPHRSWGRFTLPAAAALLAAIVGISIAVVAYDPGSDRKPAAQTTAPVASVTPTHSPTATASDLPTTATSPASPSSSSPSADTTSLHEVKVWDLSFTSTDDGWALASARCITDPSRRCTAVMRSTDGVTWKSHAGTSPFDTPDVKAGDPQVTQLRFATDTIGYAYGPDALFMTTDGGAHWKQQEGGALALETANQNVIRLVRTKDGADGLTAPIGSSAWRASGLTVLTDTTHVQLARNASDAYALVGSQFYRSADDGASWTVVKDPCANSSGPIAALAAGSRGRVALACSVSSGAGGGTRLVLSGDGGDTFVAQGPLPQQAALVGVGPTDVYLQAGKVVSRTNDSGATWGTVPGPTAITFLGFENDRVGRVVAGDGTQIWTTRNGGKTWTKVDLP